MSKLMISSLRDEQEFTSCFMVKSRQLRRFQRKVGSFLVLCLYDRSGEIEAKLWENGEEWYWKIKEQDVVEVDGKTQFFNGNLEVIIDRLRILRDGEYSLDDFLPVTEQDIDKMVATLRSAVDSVQHMYLQPLLRSFFDEAGLREFSMAPAAKAIHHAYLGGLLEHTLEVVHLCRAALEIYPMLKRDILLTGAILHDIGKTREYSYRRMIDFTDEGRLLGHIALGEQMVVEKAAEINGFPNDLLVHLRHMILSHHGHYEWQSPKRPKTIEAYVLHLADYFSSQVAVFSSLIKANAENDNSWTEYNRTLNRRIFVKDSLLHAKSCEAGYDRIDDSYQLPLEY